MATTGEPTNQRQPAQRRMARFNEVALRLMLVEGALCGLAVFVFLWVGQLMASAPDNRLATGVLTMRVAALGMACLSALLLW